MALTFKKNQNYAKISKSRSITCKKKEDFDQQFEQLVQDDGKYQNVNYIRNPKRQKIKHLLSVFYLKRSAARTLASSFLMNLLAKNRQTAGISESRIHRLKTMSVLNQVG